MKKSLLWIVVMVLSVSMVAAFSFAGCKAEEAAAAEEEVAVVEEEVAEESAEEAVVEETAEESSTIEIPDQIMKNIDGKTYKFAVSLGWVENESGRRLKSGFEEAFAFFGDEAVFSDASYDAKKQIEQIEAFIKMKPDALFVTPSDTLAITPVVRSAIEAGIPVFCADSLVANTGVITTAFSNNFGMGVYSGEYVALRLGGKGQIAIIDLPSNETWDMRALGLYWILQKYPGIEIVAKWSYDTTGVVAPRQAADNMLAANPDPGSIDAVWSAWDGGAMEAALAIKTAGRENEIFTTGIDGGEQVFEYIASDTPMALCMAQSFWEMSNTIVYYAHEYLGGRYAPRIIVTPVYAVTKERLEKGIRDDYDKPGVREELGWERDL